MEGDGTITVDANKPSKYSRCRIFISLKNLERNREMLKLIQKVLGGKVRIERNGNYVTWVITSKKDIANALTILDQYPLLSSRKRCQLEFMKSCMKNRDVNFYLQNRDSKYDKQENIAQSNKKFIQSLPDYFPAWLSGFIEAEGSFSVYNVNGQIKPKGFTIGQNYDLYLIEAIKNYFGSHHTIFKSSSKDGVDYYRIDMYGVKTRQNIQDHLLKYPLLGSKRDSYEN